eukprot:UN00956
MMIKSIGKTGALCVKERFVHSAFESSCQKKTKKSPQITSFYN